MFQTEAATEPVSQPASTRDERSMVATIIRDQAQDDAKALAKDEEPSVDDSIDTDDLDLPKKKESEERIAARKERRRKRAEANVKRENLKPLTSVTGHWVVLVC